MKKKALSILFAICIMASSCLSVSAAESPNGRYVNYFKLTRTSVVTAAKQKTDTVKNMYICVLPDRNYSDAWAQGKETLNFRARTSDQSYASNLYQTKSQGPNQFIFYYSNQGKIYNSYRLAAQYDPNNPYDYAAVAVGWTP